MDFRNDTPDDAMRFGDAAVLAKAMSDENRLQILMRLSEGQKSVSQLVEETRLSQPLVSHHLRELRHALLVSVERKGAFVYYRLSNDSIPEIIFFLRSLAKSLLRSKKGL
ncbi:MAG: metalloregulator ArsR/SmtB family transcription factor [Pseudomonadota bacterium]